MTVRSRRSMAGFVCPLEQAPLVLLLLLQTGHVPEQDFAAITVAAGSGQRFPVAAEGQTHRIADVTREGGELLAGLGIPKNRGVIAPAGSKPSAVRAEGHLEDAIGVPAQRAYLFP